MSLISSIATIATAGAAGGESYWLSSLYRTNAAIAGESLNDQANLVCEHGGTGNIFQFISSNNGSSGQGRLDSYIIKIDPSDGSILNQELYSSSASNHEFRSYLGVSYSQSMQRIVIPMNSWRDGVGSEKGLGFVGDDGEIEAFFKDYTNYCVPGNGNFVLQHDANRVDLHNYNPSTETTSGTVRKVIDDHSARAIWTDQTTNTIVTSSSRDNNTPARLNKFTYNSSTLFTAASTTRDVHWVGSTRWHNDHCDRTKLMDGNTVYGYGGPYSNQIFINQINGAALDTAKGIVLQANTSAYNGVVPNLRQSGNSMVLAGEKFYFTAQIIFRKSGTSYNYQATVLFQVNKSTFQIEAAIAFATIGGVEYVNDCVSMVTTNAEQTALYVTQTSSITNSRGTEKHRLLKLPLDLTTLTLPQQLIPSGQGIIWMWDFFSQTTGGAYPVYTELLQGPTYQSLITYSRSSVISNDTQAAATILQSDSPTNFSFTSGIAEINAG